MKTLFALLAASVILAAHLPAQSTNNLSTSRAKSRPVIGMTREKAKSYYGEPFNQAALPDGERWYYRLKFSEVYGRAWVPFYFASDNVRWGSIDFGPDGRIRSFDWQAVVLRD